jgi:hypothetical protein
VTSPSNRDRALERLLRGLPGRDDPDMRACVDFEQLAAWSDGGLSPLERRAIEGHLAGCSRCQEMVAVFARTAKAAPSRQPTLPLWRRPFVRWVVPVTAAVAATVLWMVAPEDRDAAVLSPSTSMARADPDNTPEARLEPLPERETRQMESQNRAAPPPPRANPRRADQARAGDTAEAQPSAPLARALEESDRVRSEAAAPPPVASPAAPAPPPVRQAAPVSPSAEVAAAPSPPRPQLADRSAAARSEQEMAGLFAVQAPPQVILSPDPNRQWRLASGIVQRSDDAGASWQPVALPPGPAPTTGASPSRDVCWLVGPGGLVLRTTDGTRFDAFMIPGAGDLRSIEAPDANRAVVTAVTGRVFTTEDGGRTWN